MFQIGVAVEGRLDERVATISAGWTLPSLANWEWLGALAGLIAQGVPGMRRFGVILLGFFVTIQFVDLDGARKSLIGAKMQTNSPFSGQKTRAGAVKR